MKYLLLLSPKCFCGRGSAPDPAGGAYNAPADPLVGVGQAQLALRVLATFKNNSSTSDFFTTKALRIHQYESNLSDSIFTTLL